MKRFYFANNRKNTRYVDISFEDDMSKSQFWADREVVLGVIAQMAAEGFWFAYVVGV